MKEIASTEVKLCKSIGKRYQQNYPALDPVCQARYAHWCKSGMTNMGVTNQFLIVFRWKDGYYKPGQKSTAGEILNPT